MDKDDQRTVGETNIWSGDVRQFDFYRNEQKIDDLLSRLQGSLVKSSDLKEGRGGKRQGKFAAKLGSLLLLLGVGEAGAEYSLDRSWERSRTTGNEFTYANKVEMIVSYFAEREEFRSINIYDGVEAVPPEDGAEFSLWKVKPLSLPEREFVGLVSGIFEPVKLVPPAEAETDMIREILSRENSLWEFRAVEESAFKATIPWMSEHFTRMIQGTLHYFYQAGYSHKTTTKLRLQAFGVVYPDGHGVTCDPISMALHVSVHDELE